VLKFIQKNIREFGGNPNNVTLVGTGSGAGLVGILLVSPKSYDEGEYCDTCFHLLLNENFCLSRVLM